jgi:hypothetical protein
MHDAPVKKWLPNWNVAGKMEAQLNELREAIRELKP